MKNLLAITLLIFSTLFFVACVDEDDDEWEDTEYSGDTQPSGDTTPSDPTDTGSSDTGTSDTGSADTGSADTGSTDTGDTGSADTGSADTGSADTGSADTGSTDTGSDTGDTTPAPDPTPTPVECTGFSIEPETFKYNEVKGIYTAKIPDIGTDESLEDELRISFPYAETSPVTAGSYDLNSTNNQNLSTCRECVRVFQDIKADGTPTKQFFQKGGTLTIEQVDSFNGIKGSLKANFMEVTISTDSAGDHSIPVNNGACFELESEISFDNLCVPSCKTADGENKICGSDGCGGFCGENNGVCEGENMACSADQTKCEKYECAQVSVNSLYTTSTSNEKLYYSASFNQTTGSETAENKETFTLKIRGLSMKKETDLASMSFTNNCDATVGGSPVPGQPELSSVCMSIQDKSDGYRFYFPKQGTINITTLDSNGNLSAELSGVRLVEIDTSNGIPKAGGKCLDITNETLSYTAPTE